MKIINELFIPIAVSVIFGLGGYFYLAFLDLKEGEIYEGIISYSVDAVFFTPCENVKFIDKIFATNIDFTNRRKEYDQYLKLKVYESNTDYVKVRGKLIKNKIRSFSSFEYRLVVVELEAIQPYEKGICGYSEEFQDQLWEYFL